MSSTVEELAQRVEDLEREIERLSTIETFFRQLSTGEFYTNHGITIGQDTALSAGVKLLVYNGDLTISNEDDVVGSILQIQSVNTTPADDDVAGVVRFRANDDASGAPIVAEMYGKITDVSAGSEDGAIIFALQENGTDRFSLNLVSSNIGIYTETEFGSGRGVIGIQNALANPSSNPSGGGVLYVTGGALTYRGSSGTVTTIANA